MISLLILSTAESAIGIGYVDVKLCGTFYDSLTLPGANIVGYLSTVLAVVHHQQFELLDVGDNVFVKPRGQGVTCLLGSSVTNVWHGAAGSSEFPSNTGINTLWPSPALLWWDEIIIEWEGVRESVVGMMMGGKMCPIREINKALYTNMVQRHVS